MTQDALPKLLFTLEEAAASLGISSKTLLQIVRRGEIRYVMLGERRRFSRRDIDDFIEANSRTAYVPQVAKARRQSPGKSVFDFEAMRAQRVAERKRKIERPK